MDTPSSGTVDLERGGGAIRKRLTLTFRNLNVRVTAPDAALGDTLLSYADPRQLLDVFRKSRGNKRVSTGAIYTSFESAADRKLDHPEGHQWTSQTG